eukprot:TRINITY_DN2567_c0_g1_i1.p1 TRINITY_DN2567_c0_g1~~TRINITY_DN2567_c0_g1_i1.p1  ORF type:complete len:1418 (-),score=376.49 TRINITY_DN2567_c0_g1_i1:143-4396(-)
MSLAPTVQTKKAASIWEQRAQQAQAERSKPFTRPPARSMVDPTTSSLDAKRIKPDKPDAAADDSSPSPDAIDTSEIVLNMNAVNAFMAKVGADPTGAGEFSSASLNSSLVRSDVKAKVPNKPLPDPNLNKSLPRSPGIGVPRRLSKNVDELKQQQENHKNTPKTLVSSQSASSPRTRATTVAPLSKHEPAVVSTAVPAPSTIAPVVSAPSAINATDSPRVRSTTTVAGANVVVPSAADAPASQGVDSPRARASTAVPAEPSVPPKSKPHVRPAGHDSTSPKPKIPHYSAKKVSLMDLIAQDSAKQAELPSYRKVGVASNNPSVNSSLNSSFNTNYRPPASSSPPKVNATGFRADDTTGTQSSELSTSMKMRTLERQVDLGKSQGKEVSQLEMSFEASAASSIGSNKPSLQDLVARDNSTKAAPPTWSRSANNEIEQQSRNPNPVFVEVSNPSVPRKESAQTKNSAGFEAIEYDSRKQSSASAVGAGRSVDDLGEIAYDSRMQSMADDELVQSQKSLGQLTFETDGGIAILKVNDDDDDLKESQKSLGQITFKTDAIDPAKTGGTISSFLYDSQKNILVSPAAGFTPSLTNIPSTPNAPGQDIFYDTAKVINASEIGAPAVPPSPMEEIVELEYPEDSDAKDEDLTAPEAVDTFVEGGIIEEEEVFEFVQSGMLYFMQSQGSTSDLPQANPVSPTAGQQFLSPPASNHHFPKKPSVPEPEVDGEEFTIDDESDALDTASALDSALRAEAAKSKDDVKEVQPAREEVKAVQTPPLQVEESSALNMPQAPDSLALSTRSSSSDKFPTFGSDPSSLVAMLGSIMESRPHDDDSSMFTSAEDAVIPDSIKDILNSVANEMKSAPPSNSSKVDLRVEDDDADFEDALDAIDKMSVADPIAEEGEDFTESSFSGTASQRQKPKVLVAKTSGGQSALRLGRAASDPMELPQVGPSLASPRSSLTITVTSPQAAPETPKSTKSFKKPPSLSDLVQSESSPYASPAVKPAKRSSFSFQDPNSQMSVSLDSGNLFKMRPSPSASPRSDGTASPLSSSGGRKSKIAEQLEKEIEEAKRVAEIQAQMSARRASLVAKCAVDAQEEERRKSILQDSEEQSRLKRRAEEFKRLEEEQRLKLEAEQEKQRIIDAEIRMKLKQEENALLAKARSGKRMSFYEKKLVDKAMGVSDDDEEADGRRRRHSSMISERPDVMRLASSPRMTDDIKKVMEDVDKQLEMKLEFWKSLGNVDNAIIKLKENDPNTTDLTMNVSTVLDQYPLGDPERIRIAKEFANAIADNPYLESIDLSNSKLDDVFAVELGSRLEQGALPQLTSINLESNCLTGKGVQSLCDGFQDMIKHQAIKVIKLSNQSAISTEAEQAALNMLKFNLSIRACSVDFRRQVDYVEATRLLSRNVGIASQQKSRNRMLSL